LPSFADRSPEDWDQWAKTRGLPAFRGKQIKSWLFEKHTHDPLLMSNIDPKTRAMLLEDFDWRLPMIHEQLEAPDGSTKLLLRTHSGHFIEAVILRYENRVSLCVSSQVGCKLACTFCQTGKLGFMRHLSAAEIVGQYLLAQQITKLEGRRISHLVFMGMGEPLDNYDATLKAVNLMLAEDAYNLGNRHVTISTSGIAPKIISLAHDTKASLALSLHAANDELRTELMPINRRYPLAELKKALLYHQKETGRKVTIEFILIKDKTCTTTQAAHLVKFLAGLSAKVNLIAFNEHPGLGYQRPSEEEIREFQQFLASRSIPAPVRYSKGLEVSGACGQLAAKTTQNLQELPSRKSLLNSQALPLSQSLSQSLQQSSAPS
jgi:23S rRNA (adenine2503-C2)-methyltransferase